MMKNFPYSEDELSELNQDLLELEGSIGWESGLIESIASESDWAFVIKAHALVEGVLSNWLAEKIGQAKLIEPLSHVELGQPKYGKIALSKALGLTSEFDRKLLRELGKLRNQLAHRAENVGFKFADYLSKADKNQKNNFIDSFGYCYLAEDAAGKPFIPDRELILEAPKLAVHLSLKIFLATVGHQISYFKAERKIQRMKLKQLELYQELRKHEKP